MRNGCKVESEIEIEIDVRFKIWSIFITKERNCFPRSSSSSRTSNSVNITLDSLGEIW